MLKLYNHQKELIDKNPKKYLLAHGCGSGKTITSIKLVEKKNEIALIICPKSIRHQWEEELDKHAIDSNKWCVITKEEFRRDWNKISKYNAICIDEFHFFLGMTGYRKKSAMLKSLLSYIKKHNPEIIYGLTATPFLSSPYNLYAAWEILGLVPTELKRKYEFHRKFKEHFFSMVNMGGRFPVPIMKKNIEKDIARMVNKIGNTVSLQDCFDVPEQTFITEYFDLTGEQKKAINNLEEEGIARWTKTHQICGGSLKGDGYTENKYFNCEKTKRVSELAKEHDKLIIVCRYNNEINYLKTLLKGVECLVVNGSVKDRHSIINKANTSKKCIVLIQAGCSEGYELPTFPIMVFYSYDFSLKNYIQIKGRILRANKLKKNLYISLVVRNSIDNDVYKCIKAKKKFDIAIYNK